MQSEQLLMEVQALESKLKAQSQQEESLFKKLKSQQGVVVELKEQNRKLHQNFTLQFNQQREQMRHLQEDQYKVSNDNTSRIAELSELKQQIAKKDDQLMRQQTQINDLTSQLKEREGFQRRIVSMREELIIWYAKKPLEVIKEMIYIYIMICFCREEQHKRMKENAKDLLELRQQLAHREDAISRLLQQVEEANTRNTYAIPTKAVLVAN